MGCDFDGFIEIATETADEYDSLYAIQSHMPRHYELFGALAGVRSAIKPLFPPRGIPKNLSVHGFRTCFRPIVSHTDALDWRESNFVLPWGVGPSPVSHDSRWAVSKLGYIPNQALESPSWLLLQEIHQAIEHASIDPATLPAEYRCVFQTMALAESVYGRHTRLVFWFHDV